MTTSVRFFILALVAAIMLCSLPACDSSPGEREFDRVENGMSKAEVFDILGEPTETSGLELGGLSGTSAVWENDRTRMTIQFINDKVKIKQFTRSDNSPIE